MSAFSLNQMSRGRSSHCHSPRSSNGSSNSSPSGSPTRGHLAPLYTIPTNAITTPGTYGTPVELTTNFIEWIAEKPQAQTYHVTFDPDVEQTNTRRQIINQSRLDGILPAAAIYDGDANLKTLDPVEVLAFDITVGGNVYKVTLSSPGVINMGSCEMMRLYNTQSRNNLRHLGFVPIGRDFYDPTTQTQLNVPNVSLWFGMETTVLPCTDDRQLMVLNSISKVIRKETPMDLMIEIRKSHPNDFQTHVRNALVGRTVLTKYNNRHYRIADVDFDSNPGSKFPYTDRNTKITREITFAEYVHNQYNQTVKRMTQPLLVTSLTAREKRSGKTEAAKLIPELCILTGIADIIADTSLRREMISATMKRPDVRVKDMLNFMSQCAANEEINKEMKQWGLKFGSSLVTLTGRQLPTERVTMSKDGRPSHFDAFNGDFDSQLKNHQLKEPKTVHKWSVIFSVRDSNLVNPFFATLNEQCKRVGLSLKRPDIVKLPGNRIHDYLSAINQLPDDCELVITIISRTSETEKYTALKKRLCCEKPIPSQVIVAFNLRDPKRATSIALKVAIQINCKLGGVPWEVDMPPVDLMVVGYDCHHDTMMRRSVGGFVSSLNRQATKWYSRVNYHDNLQELSTHFATNMRLAMAAFHKHNNKYPDKVIVYRDGVSEGQISHVYLIEREQIKMVLDELSPSKRIGLAIVIVTKGIAARLFTNQNNSYGNPGPGTVVDSVITRANSYDFFLISQATRGGTVCPVNYNVIEDTTGWSRSHHERLAYKLCHLCFNWAGTVTVPCACQYAHELSYLVGTHLHQVPHESLCERLFFL